MRQEEQACEGLLFWKGKNMRYDAFISYRRDNGFLMAQVIHDHLEERGIHCFLDLEELQAGVFDEKIYDAIQDSPNFILILQPNAPNRCTDEEDWVAKEIIAATKMKKKIIPVLCEGFEWPKALYPKLPIQVKNIENVNAVQASQYYLQAMIDKLIEFMVEIYPVQMTINRFDIINRSISTKNYFLEGMKRDIHSVEMAFHAGAWWHWDGDMVDILCSLLEAKISIKVLLNTPKAAKLLGSHMRNRRQRYRKFKKCISDWKKAEEKYSEYLEVRVSDLPLLRRYYHIHYQEEKYDTVNVMHYTYANPKIEKDFQSIFGMESDYFRLYQSEFEYLWKNAVSIDSLRN